MVQSIYLSASTRPYIFISVAITGEGGIGIRLVSGRVAAIIAALLGNFSLDIIDLIDFTARAGLLGNAIDNFVLLLESI